MPRYMTHCNSAFPPNDIWYLLDKDGLTKRKLYLATCPICCKLMAFYNYTKEDGTEEVKTYYSGGARRMMDELKKDMVGSMLRWRDKCKQGNPSGFIYGINKETKKEIRQYASDFYGRRVIIKKIAKNGN